MNPALRSLRPGYSTNLHPPRRALFTAFVAAVTITAILAPAVWLLTTLP